MRRVPELDALRGLASLIILLLHARVFEGVAILGTLWAGFGWGGVDLFFVLSGYLITSIILRSGSQSGFLRSFYARRGLRIWPIYYLLMLGVIAVNLALPTHPIPMQGMPQYLTYTQGIPAYWGSESPGQLEWLGHTWTLAIEEQFYLVWPFLVLLVPRRRLIPTCLAIALFSMIIRSSWPNRIASFLDLGIHFPAAAQWLLLGRIDGFALGGLLAVLMTDPRTTTLRRRRFERLFAGIALAAAVYLVTCSLAFSKIPAAPSMTTLVSFGVVGLVLLNAGSHRLRFLRWSWLCYLGLISYGLYLLHPIVFELFHLSRPWFGSRAWLVSPLMLLASLAVAILSWHLIEQPILRFKDRFGYNDNRPKTASVPHPQNPPQTFPEPEPAS